MVLLPDGGSADGEGDDGDAAEDQADVLRRHGPLPEDRPGQADRDGGIERRDHGDDGVTARRSPWAPPGWAPPARGPSAPPALGPWAPPALGPRAPPALGPRAPPALGPRAPPARRRDGSADLVRPADTSQMPGSAIATPSSPAGGSMPAVKSAAPYAAADASARTIPITHNPSGSVWRRLDAARAHRCLPTRGRDREEVPFEALRERPISRPHDRRADGTAPTSRV